MGWAARLAAARAAYERRPCPGLHADIARAFAAHLLALPGAAMVCPRAAYRAHQLARR